jgi:hypothetical protein
VRGAAARAAFALALALAPGVPGSSDAGPAPADSARSAPAALGWYPPADPESAAVRRGRREAPAVDLPLAGGRASLDALARAALAGAAAGAPESLLALCVNEREFTRLLWPEFPQSRPATGLLPMDGWRTLFNRLTSGCHGATGDLAGQAWTYVRVEAGSGVMEFRNFRLHRGVAIVVRDASGAEQRLDFLRTAVERDGVFKIYSMRD